MQKRLKLLLFIFFGLILITIGFIVFKPFNYKAATGDAGIMKVIVKWSQGKVELSSFLKQLAP